MLHLPHSCRRRLDRLPKPSRREAFVLDRVGASADPAVRLACQLRPEHDIAFFLVFPPQVDAARRVVRRSIQVGEERYIVSMFVDMRRSTAMAEKRLPFDTVFIINRFLAAVSSAIEGAGGRPNQFVGDGILALFGLEKDPAIACRQAIDAHRENCRQCRAVEPRSCARPAGSRSSTALASMAARSSLAILAIASTLCSRRWAIRSTSRRGCKTWPRNSAAR